MATASSSRQNSRFSSFNVFKFSPSAKPPPPPPKDPLYACNPSLPSLNTSLSQDLLTSPQQAPLYSQYSKYPRSPSPSPSHAPSRMTMSTTSSSSAVSPEPAGLRKSLQKLSSFGRRPKTPKSPETDPMDLQPPEPADDPSISLPWNFQHNLHVDENCNGMPPTWSARLAEMGLNEEEIATIQARRTATRTNVKSIYSFNNDRNTILANSDRNTILASNPPSAMYRGMSDASMSQTSLSSGTSASRSHYRNLSRAASSTSELVTSDAESRSAARFARSLSPPTRLVPVPVLTESSSSSSSVSVSTKDPVPNTPPRRAYHVVNESYGSLPSPPPAYTSPKQGAPLQDVNEGLRAQGSSGLPLDEKAAIRVAVGGSTSAVAGPSSSSSSSSRAAPRLSLQRDGLGDLSSWSESLFSIIPPESSSPDVPAARPRLPHSTSQPASAPSRTPASVRLRARSHSRTSSTHRNLPPQKPIPLYELPPRASPSSSSAQNSPPPSANKSSPLWQEVMDMVRPAPSAGSGTSIESLQKPQSSSALTTTSTSASSWMPRTPEHEYPEPHLLHPRTPTRFDDSASDNGIGSEEEDGTLQVRRRDKENRDSDLSTMTVVPATIVQGSIARSARGNIVASPTKKAGEEGGQRQSAFLINSTLPMADKADSASHRSQSTVSSASRSSGSSVSTTAFGSGSTPSSAYTKVSPAPSPRISTTFASAESDHERVSPARLDKGKSPLPEIQLDLDIDLDLDLGVLQRPSVLIDDIIATGVLSEPSNSPSQSPSTPAPRYPGWVSEVVAPLSEFIDETVDPRALYGDLREVGEGDSGSVYAARVLAPAKGKAKGSEEADANATYVAIKNVPLLPSGSPKLLDLRRELRLMRDVRHPNVLTMDEALVDIVEDALWMKMELMERSLADILILVEEGIVVHEKPIAQFASDVLHALSYLQKLGIAHRDLRSDNLLVNSAGVVKLADFSNAVRVSPEEPLCTDAVGVIYFQAPEMRRGPYNGLKVDIWSLGATIWELAQSEPPFSDITDASQAADRWPPLNQPEIYSRSFHDFLHLCSQPSLSRPDPNELLKTPFIRSASGRPAIVKLLTECRSIEERTFRRQSVGSNGTISMS